MDEDGQKRKDLITERDETQLTRKRNMRERELFYFCCAACFAIPRALKAALLAKTAAKIMTYPPLRWKMINISFFCRSFINVNRRKTLPVDLDSSFSPTDGLYANCWSLSQPLPTNSRKGTSQIYEFNLREHFQFLYNAKIQFVLSNR